MDTLPDAMRIREHVLQKWEAADRDPGLIDDGALNVVIVAPCGYGLDGASALAERLVAAGVLPTAAEVWTVDADALVVRPGPRVVDGVAAFASILHLDRCGPPDSSVTRRIA